MPPFLLRTSVQQIRNKAFDPRQGSGPASCRSLQIFAQCGYVAGARLIFDEHAPEGSASNRRPIQLETRIRPIGPQFADTKLGVTAHLFAGKRSERSGRWPRADGSPSCLRLARLRAHFPARRSRKLFVPPDIEFGANSLPRSATQFRSRFSSAKSDAYKVHALVRILFAQPYNQVILPHFVSFRLRRNSSDMSSGYAPSITMVRFQRRKTAA